MDPKQQERAEQFDSDVAHHAGIVSNHVIRSNKMFEIEGNTSTGVATNKKKTKERPEISVYKPGSGLLKKRTGQDPKNETSSSSPSGLESKLSALSVKDEPNKNKSDAERETQEARKKKRPEMPVYVPKPKVMLSVSPDTSEKPAQVDDKPPSATKAREVQPEPPAFKPATKPSGNAKKSYNQSRPLKTEERHFDKKREDPDPRQQPTEGRRLDNYNDERSQQRPTKPHPDRRPNPRQNRNWDGTPPRSHDWAQEENSTRELPFRTVGKNTGPQPGDRNQKSQDREPRIHPRYGDQQRQDDKGRRFQPRQNTGRWDLPVHRSGSQDIWADQDVHVQTSKVQNNAPKTLQSKVKEEDWGDPPGVQIHTVMPTAPFSATYKQQESKWDLEAQSNFATNSGPASLPITPSSETASGTKGKKKRRRKGRRSSIASSVTSESALSDEESIKSSSGRYRRRSSRDSMASLIERPDSPSLYVRRSSYNQPMPRQASEPPMYDPPPPDSRHRMDSKPPLPANYHTLPPRLKKRYDAMSSSPPVPAPLPPPLPSPQPLMSIVLAEDWDGTSLTFSSRKPIPALCPPAPIPFPQPFQLQPEAVPPVLHQVQLPQFGATLQAKGGRGRGMVQLSHSHRNSPVPGFYQTEEEMDLDIDNFLVRARSQDSLCGLDDRKNNPPSRCSTPSSPGPAMRPYRRESVDSPVKSTPLPPPQPIKHTHVADWNAEVESSENEAQLQAPKPAPKSPPPVSKLAQPASTASNPIKPVIVYTCTDVRYRNKEESSSGNSSNVSSSANPIVKGGARESEKPHGQPSPSQQPYNAQNPGNSGMNKGGLLILPPSSRAECFTADNNRNPPNPRKQLYDPNKPSPPPNFHGPPPNMPNTNNMLHTYPQIPSRGFPPYGEGYGNMNMGIVPVPNAVSPGAPAWYNPYSESFRTARCDPLLLLDMKRADMELQWILHSPMQQGPVDQWNRVSVIRRFLQTSLETLLGSDIRFCQVENLEQHVWKLAFHQLIELLRQGYAQQQDPALKEEYKNLLLQLIDEGVSFFTKLLELLQETYHFQLESFTSEPAIRATRNLGPVGLALVSAQKLLIYLGDLTRYREIVCDTTSYGKARSWYVKANNVNPKNGRPYNQLAILALYARRKLDAVYLYMRSLMASNPFQSAKESLISLFDENRKKFELQERKRREGKEAKRKLELQARGGDQERGGAHRVRREIWIHPSGGKRVHRTTSTTEEMANSDNEELTKLPSVEVNKRFVISYLHVQGKLYTKIGMETFHESALLMLREFRALLQHSPIPLTETRFLQLLALNMFALENTQLKDTRVDPGYRSALQEYALIVSLEMFGLILERCISVLEEEIANRHKQPPSCSQRRLFGEDLQNMLAAVKIWCDWLLCHSSLWNPPPSSSDYHVGPPGDPWTRLATVINLLEKIDTRAVDLQATPLDGYRRVRLPEDAFLCGFTPLMSCIQEPVYAKSEVDMDVAGDYVRVQRLLYVGRDYLCGLEPPVLKLQRLDAQKAQYVSLVSKNMVPKPGSASEGTVKNEESTDEDGGDVVLESYSEEEDEGVVDDASEEMASTTSSQIRKLRLRKETLQRKHQKQERRRKRIEAVLRGSVKVEIEVQPRLVVADTNCYIDHIFALRKLVSEGPYTLVVPLIVLAELDGLGRGARASSSEGPSFIRIPSAEMTSLRGARLAEAAKHALAFLKVRHPRIKCVTTKGTVMPSVTLVQEEDEEQDLKNDDRILKVCLFLCREAGREIGDKDGVRRLCRDVVLLTEDRNLRVKALAQDVPVRDLPDFVAWANLAPTVGT